MRECPHECSIKQSILGIKLNSLGAVLKTSLSVAGKSNANVAIKRTDIGLWNQYQTRRYTLPPIVEKTQSF